MWGTGWREKRGNTAFIDWALKRVCFVGTSKITLDSFWSHVLFLIFDRLIYQIGDKCTITISNRKSKDKNWTCSELLMTKIEVFETVMNQCQSFWWYHLLKLTETKEWTFRIYSNWDQIYKPSISLYSTHLDDNTDCIFPKGVDRFSADVEAMTGRKAFLWFRICWKYITPVCTIVSGLKEPYRYSEHVKL